VNPEYLRRLSTKLHLVMSPGGPLSLFTFRISGSLERTYIYLFLLQRASLLRILALAFSNPEDTDSMAPQRRTRSATKAGQTQTSGTTPTATAPATGSATSGASQAITRKARPILEFG
jgi:hypothetical protein